jgi:flagellin
MGMSVNTNIASMTALRHLTQVNAGLEKTQLHITTGLRVNGPQEDAATYAIAQKMRGDISGMHAVKTALETADATINVAISAAEEVSALLLEMKAKTVQGMQAGLDASSRTALTNDFYALRDQIDTVVTSADFNGVNLVKDGASSLSVLTTVQGSTVSVSAQPMAAITLQFGLPNIDLYSASNASGSLNVVNSAIDTVSDALASLGAAAKRIEVQGDFTGKLTDILKDNVGSLVDADMEEESATLQSLQIRQQLAVQALSMANSAPQTILSLFG